MVRPYNPPHITTGFAEDDGWFLQSLNETVLFQYRHQPLGPGCLSNAIGASLHDVRQRDELVIGVQQRPIQQRLGVQ